MDILIYFLLLEINTCMCFVFFFRIRKPLSIWLRLILPSPGSVTPLYDANSKKKTANSVHLSKLNVKNLYIAFYCLIYVYVNTFSREKQNTSISSWPSEIHQTLNVQVVEHEIDQWDKTLFTTSKGIYRVNRYGYFFHGILTDESRK